jgi:hypothetical protein
MTCCDYNERNVLGKTSVIVSPPPADYNHEDYRDQIILRAQETRAAFSHTVVIQFSNWWTQGAYDYLHAALAGCADAGVGIGGPDIHPDSSIEAYADYCPNSGIVPLGCAAQTSSYNGDWTVEELFDWGVSLWPDGLCLNYFFWLRRQDDAAAFHFDPDVIDHVNAMDGAVYSTACPANIAPCG